MSLFICLFRHKIPLKSVTPPHLEIFWEKKKKRKKKRRKEEREEEEED